jgi:hypothetical protein
MAADTGTGDALVYSLTVFIRDAARILAEIEETGKPAFITRLGRFIAVITPLKPGEVESRVLPEMAREIGAQLGEGGGEHG